MRMHWQLRGSGGAVGRPRGGLLLCVLVLVTTTMTLFPLHDNVVVEGRRHFIVDGRPTQSQEQNQHYWISFAKGLHVGYEDVLSLLGYYEGEEVKVNLAAMNVQQELNDANTAEDDDEADDDDEDDDDFVGGRNENNDIFWQIDPEDEPDKTEIKVVGLGLGRTGTTSMVVALELLGYTVVHDDEQPELTDLYVARDSRMLDMDDFHEVLGLRGYNATFKTADHKWVAKAIQDQSNTVIKAILTVRDTPDKYVDSWLGAARFYELMLCRPFTWMPTVQRILPSLKYEYTHEPILGTNTKTTDTDEEKKEHTDNQNNPSSNSLYGNSDIENWLDRDTLKEGYTNYIEAVKKAIPSDRLLIFNVKEGWEPLCQFLNHDATNPSSSTTSSTSTFYTKTPCPPDDGMPFPHVHTRAKLDGEMAFLFLITWVWPFVLAVPVLMVLGSIGTILYHCGWISRAPARPDTNNINNNNNNNHKKKTE